MNKKSFRITVAVLLIIWMALIFALSAQTASESIQTSAGFTYRVFSCVYPDFTEMTAAEQQEIISQFSHLVRKAAHFTLYFILGLLAFLNTAAYPKIILPLKGLFSFMFSALYAASDEFHQLYVEGRGGQLSDVAIDSAGALLSILISMLIYKGVDNKMRKKNLIKQNGELFDRLNDANARIAELEKEVAERDSELESLNDQVIELRRELAHLNTEPKSEESISEVAVAVEPEAEAPAEAQLIAEEKPVNIEPTVEEKTEPISEETQARPEEAAVLSEPELKAEYKAPEDKSVDYGSQVIGKIVVSAAQYSNRLTAGGSSQNRELVNLILGKTEVAKAEILDITTSEAEEALKKQMIDSVYEEAVEYFGTIMAQI